MTDDEGVGALVESYVPAVAEVPSTNKTVAEYFYHAAASVPDRLALVEVPHSQRSQGRTWTYRRLQHECECVAGVLLQHFKRGDNVAVWSENRVEYVILQLGAALAGVVLVTLNPAAGIKELHYLLEQSRSTGLIMSSEFRGMDNVAAVDAIRPELPLLKKIFHLEQWDDFLAAGNVAVTLPDIDIDDPVLILYTSGTIGKPKGVVMRHRAAVFNAQATMIRFGLDPGSVWLSTLPMAHIGGSITTTLGCIGNLGTLVVLPEAKPDVMMHLIEEYEVAIAMVAPPMIVDMLEHETFGKFDLSSLRLMVTGGMIVPAEIVHIVRNKFKVDIGIVFGQVEAGGAMAMTYRGESEERLVNSVGRAISGCEMKIVQSGNGKPLPIGMSGEVCVRSVCQMKGYFDMPEATADVIDAEGWLHTGDIGVMRADGYVQITGRVKT